MTTETVADALTNVGGPGILVGLIYFAYRVLQENMSAAAVERARIVEERDAAIEAADKLRKLNTAMTAKFLMANAQLVALGLSEQMTAEDIINMLQVKIDSEE